MEPKQIDPVPQCSYCGEDIGKCATLDGRRDGVCVEYASFWMYEAQGMGL